MSKTFWTIVVVLLCAGVVGAVVVFHLPGRTEVKNQPPVKIAVTTNPHAYIPNNIPATMPPGLPVEQGAKIIIDYGGFNVTTSSSVSVLEFASAKSGADNLTLYQSWLEQHNWENISTTSTKPSVISLMATQQKSSITISVYGPAHGNGDVFIAYTNVK